jgi:hypothetical protein
MVPRPEDDPYRKLGLDPGADEAAVRQAYRRLAQLHHPDHNGGSPEAARRFEEIHAAYLGILRRRAAAAPTRSETEEAELSARLAALEQELQSAHRARRRRERRARKASARSPAGQSTERGAPAAAQLSSLIEGLEALASQLDGFE